MKAPDMLKIGIALALTATTFTAAAQVIDIDELTARSEACINFDTEEMQRQCVGDIAFTMSLAALQCFKINNNTERLACYDIASDRPIEPVTEEASQWAIRTETSEMTDQSNIYMSVIAEDYVSCGFSGPSKPTLFVRCRENTTSIIVATSCHVTGSLGYGEITYRLDNLDARSKNFRESTDNRNLGLWNGGAAIPFIKAMFGHETMLMRFTPYGDNAVEPRFNIAGLEEAIAPLREACHW